MLKRGAFNEVRYIGVIVGADVDACVSCKFPADSWRPSRDDKVYHGNVAGVSEGDISDINI
jgi:hypothetical protein